MASIPLPALHVQPPADPSEGIQRLLALRQQLAMQPGQLELQKQAVAQGQAETQLKQQAVVNQQAGLKAMQEWDGKDISTLPGLYAKHGADATTVMSLKGNILKQQQDLANLDKDSLANEATRNDQLLGHLDAIKGVTDPAQRATAAKTQAQQILDAKLVRDPQTAQMIQAIASGQTVPDDNQLALFEKGLTAHKAQIEQAKSAAQTQEATARAGEAGAQQKKIEAETAGLAGPLAEAEYRRILAKKASGQQLVPSEQFFAQGFEASQAKTTTQADSLGITSTNTSRPAGLATVGGRGHPSIVPSPSSIIPNATPGPVHQVPLGGGTVPPASSNVKPQNLEESIVDSIGQYKYPVTNLNRFVVKHPEIIAQVNQKYPDWSQPNYNSISKAVTDLAPSGKTGQQITSYNTFLRHAGALYDAVDSLNNSKYSDLLNKPINWLQQHLGDPRVADFMAAMQPPMKEFQSFLLNNHAMHDEDVKDAHSLIDVDKTPQEIRAVLKRFAEMGSARLSEQNESFKRVTGKDIPNLVSPAAAAAYNKIVNGGSTGGLKIGQKVTLKNGQTVTIKAVHPDGSFDAN